jgi:uncharacterized membrane protein
MSDGRLMCLAIFCILLVSPLAAAATPASNRTAADSAGGQDITDLAVDPTGQFVAAVVAYDNTRISGLIGASRDDVYLCDYGAAASPNSGGCRGLRHSPTVTPSSQPLNAPQRVDAAYEDGGGRQGVFAVAGPSYFLSAWRSTLNVPSWTTRTVDNLTALNISFTGDAKRVVVGTAPTAISAGGYVEVRNVENAGALLWRIALSNAAGANVRPTSLDVSRTGNLLAIGTSDGLLVTDPTTGTAPTGTLGGIPQVDAVNRAILSADGRFVVAAASNGIFLGTITRENGKPVITPSTVFNRGFGAPAQEAAFALDGSRFAAASGTKIHFFQRLDTAAVAEPVGEAYDAGATVSSIAYDAKGELLVAVAGSKVFGFGPGKNTPIWSFDATQAAYGAVDAPLREVAVSDDAQRVIVAGKTKTMAYSNVLGVAATLVSTNATTTLAPTQTLSLSLTVKNTGSLTDNYSFSVVTPIGWPTATAPSARLDPDETRTVRFDVTAPAGGEPGVYGVQVRVRSALSEERNPQVGYIASPSFNISIPRSVVLKVEAPDDRLLLRQGGEQTVAVTLRNEGNARGVVNLSARQELTRGASWDIRFTPEQVEVPAAGSAQISMIVSAPSDSGSGDRNVITIRAREGTSVEATDQIIAYVDAQFGAELRTNRTGWEFYPGQVQTIRLNVTNIGNTDDLYNLTSAVTPTAVESDWRVTLESEQLSVTRGQTKQITVTVKAVASDAHDATLTLRTISQSAPDRTENSLVLNLIPIPRPPTDTDRDRLLPGLAPMLVVLAIALLAVARHGGRR